MKKLKGSIRSKVTVTIFLLILSGMSVFGFAAGDERYSEKENRYLAIKPDLDSGNLLNGKYQEDYETYLADKTVFRNKWIEFKTYIELASLKKDVNGVYFGKDNYLIARQDTDKFETENADRNCEYLEEFVDNYKKNTDICVMLVPNTSEILKEKLPKYAYNFNETKYINDIYKEIGEDNTVDVNEILKVHKDEYLYYKTDHHWTTLGAYYAFTEYADKTGINIEKYTTKLVTDKFYGTMSSKVNLEIEADKVYIYEADKEEDVSVSYNNSTELKDSLYEMSALDKKDKYSIFLGGNNPLVQITTNAKNDRKVLVIKDSFAHCFIPFMISGFSKIDVVDLRYYNESIEKMIEEGGYTDILVLYNVGNFVEDKNIYKLVN